VTVFKNIGYYGFFAGPDVHIIDPYGIGDPLMARIPFKTTDRWASGHFFRVVPDGYPEAAIGEGEIKNPAVAAYWERLKLVTRGKVFDRGRLLEVLRFNLGMIQKPPG
jgi:arabinofuranosyltransferase